MKPNYTTFLAESLKRRKKIMALYNQGKSLAEIARIMDVSRQRVHYLVRVKNGK